MIEGKMIPEEDEIFEECICTCCTTSLLGTPHCNCLEYDPEERCHCLHCKIMMDIMGGGV
jgi:hypothetical protein